MVRTPREQEGNNAGRGSSPARSVQPSDRVAIVPRDLVAGMGAANRTLLASFLALFDETTLRRRAIARAEAAGSEIQRRLGSQPERTGVEWDEQRQSWEASAYSTDELRVALYVRLRHTLNLPVRLSATRRGCGHLADDIAARLVHLLDPPAPVQSGKSRLQRAGWLGEGEQAQTLADVVVPILDQMLAQAPGDETVEQDPERRRAQLLAQLEALSSEDGSNHSGLFDPAGQTNQINDTALGRMLLVGGTWTAFGAGVGGTGFSSYIVAAQASAFLPFVSGPGLVSTVAVLANPITVGAGTAGAIYWFSRKASRSVDAAIASHVVALLTILGLCSRRVSVEHLLNAFASVPALDAGLGLPSQRFSEYQTEWAALAKFWHEKATGPTDRVRRLTDMRVEPPSSANPNGEDDPRRGEETTNAVALSAMTVGDVLYSVAAVDPTVIRAADFSRLAEIEGSVDFARLAQDVLSGSEDAVAGATNQLKGYVAERTVAADLTAAGHTVTFPSASNQAGYDLLVDGEAMQVKFHADTGGLEEHFARYDYPVIANSELADQIPAEWADRVFFVDGLSNDVVTHVTEESLRAGEDLLEPGVPYMAGLISAARGMHAYHSGQVTGVQALEQTIMDGSIRVTLAGTGAVVGPSVGALLFGPAGAWVLGAASPVLFQTQTRRAATFLSERVPWQRRRQWDDDAHGAIDGLQGAALRGLKRKREQIARKLASLPANEAGQYLRWRLLDDGRFTRECECRIAATQRDEASTPEQRLTQTVRWLKFSGLHPVTYQEALREAGEVLERRPGLAELAEDSGAREAPARLREAVDRGTKRTADWFEGSGLKERARSARQRFRRGASDEPED